MPNQGKHKSEIQEKLAHWFPEGFWTEGKPDGLLERDWDILVAHVRDQQGYKNISTNYGISVVRVRQIVRQTFMRVSCSATNKNRNNYVCCVCGIVPDLSKLKYRWTCPYNQAYQDNSVYRKYVGPQCESCDFVPVHICQLDIHHIDGNHNNHAPSNLQTLCANCHRYIHIS
jgi:hypothetical protein